MQVDDYAAADAARRKLAPKTGFRLFTSSLSNLGRQRTKSTTSNDNGKTEDADGAQIRPSTGTVEAFITLDGSAISDFHENGDVYRWAILYENQRGCVLY